MYLSIRDDTVMAAGYESIANGLHDLGIAGVELFVHRDDTVTAIESGSGQGRLSLSKPAELAELIRQASASRVTISALCMANDFNSDHKQEEVDWTIRTVLAAAEIGAPAIRIDAIMSGEKHLPLGERQRLFAQSALSILDATSHTDIDLGVENHGYQGNDPEFLTGLLLEVDSPRLGLTLDSGNFYWRGWPLSRVYEIFEQFASVVKHTHIKNIAYPPEIREEQREIGFEYGKYVSPIHEGDIDHSRYFAALRKAGYDRDLCLEDESLGKYAPAQRQANLRAAADFFRAQIG